MFKLFLYFLIFYFGYRVLSGAFKSPSKKVNVGGRSRSKPLDLTDQDVEDADYKELEDDK